MIQINNVISQNINRINESWRDFMNNTMVELNQEGKLLNAPNLLQKVSFFKILIIKRRFRYFKQLLEAISII